MAPTQTSLASTRRAEETFSERAVRQREETLTLVRKPLSARGARKSQGQTADVRDAAKPRRTAVPRADLIAIGGGEPYGSACAYELERIGDRKLDLPEATPAVAGLAIGGTR